MTDQELMEARAAVEDCYRRRARRAGLEETLPKDWPMTEEEINKLSETGRRQGEQSQEGEGN